MHITGSRLKALLLIAVISTVVSLYQWIALITLRSGESVAFCLAGSWMDCEAVWNSPLSLGIQQYTLLPAAAWGVLWGLAVVVMIFRVVFLRRQQLSNENISNGLCFLLLMAAVLATVLLVYGGLHSGICLTCLIFYALVYMGCFIMLRGCQASAGALLRGAGQLPAVTVGIYVLLLYPAINTPLVTQARVEPTIQALGDQDEKGFLQHPLALYLQSLTVDMQQTLSVALFIYRTSPYVEQPIDEKRLLFGPKEAPVHFSGWVDMHQCPQCRYIEESLFRLRRASPRGSWNYEIRQFPIASQCNPYIKIKDPSGVSCLGAKILICTKNTSMNDLLRLNFYRNMAVLTPGTMWKIVNDSGLDGQAMKQCVNADETKKQLSKDIEDARANFIRGVPMIAVNGRKATFHPSFLYSLILSEGKDEHPAYSVMAPPSSK